MLTCVDTLMADERAEVSLSDLTRWLVVAAVVLAGIVLFLIMAPRTPAVVSPATQELAP